MTTNLCKIRFKVIYETSSANQTIKVVGNIKELGDWNINKAIPFIKSEIEKNVWNSHEILVNKSALSNEKISPNANNYFRNKPSAKEFEFGKNSISYGNKFKGSVETKSINASEVNLFSSQ